MFDLEKAVDTWCNHVITKKLWDGDKIDELKDHLYCVIEQEVAYGSSEQQAFDKATTDMGYQDSLVNDPASKAKVLQSICRLLNKIEPHPSQDAPVLIAHSLIWAAMMIAMALVVDDKQTNQSILFILLLGWFASFAALNRTKRSAKDEWRCLKQWFTKN
ncbi:hypothetical protein PALB_500 [Pseudoalteromonas luteoviolacea B = ATCC 29581]|nr:hypothetical protein PALB_500 [Pseudoalteromonas luteoviolacea B = ATCC 29581]